MAVITAVILYQSFDWQCTDLIAALLVTGLMVPRAVMLLRSAIRILLEATPAELDTGDIRGHFAKFPVSQTYTIFMFLRFELG